MTGFGARGPDKLKPGYDLIASAVGGGMHVTGEKVRNLLLKKKTNQSIFQTRQIL